MKIEFPSDHQINQNLKAFIIQKLTYLQESTQLQ